MNKIKSRPSAEILSNPISPLLWAKNAHGREWIRVKCRPYAEILYNISSKFDDPPAVGSKKPTAVLIRVKSRPCAENLSSPLSQFYDHPYHGVPWGQKCLRQC